MTVHGFRHTHCSLLFEAGVSIKDVQERMGHTDIKTTMTIYAHVTEQRKEKKKLLMTLQPSWQTAAQIQIKILAVVKGVVKCKKRGFPINRKTSRKLIRQPLDNVCLILQRLCL